MTPTPAHPEPPRRAFDWKNLAVRLGTAAIFGIFFLTLLYFGEHRWAKLTFLGLMAVAVLMGTREMTLLGRKMGFRPSWVAGTLVGWAFLVHFFLLGLPGPAVDAFPLWFVLAAGAVVIHFGALLLDADLAKALPSQAVTWMGALVLGVGLGFQQKLFMFNDTTLTNTGGRLVLALYIITWFGDSAAYFVGSSLGRHKLAPHVSPKKTWEGLAGNYLGNVGGAFLMKALVCTQWSAVDAVAIGLLLGTVGQMGDLVESTWKRSAGVKDSDMGFSIPGHGGMLDRVDSLVFTAPALYAYVHFVHGLN